MMHHSRKAVRVTETELASLPVVAAGDLIQCQHCQGRHALEVARHPSGYPVAGGAILVYRCGERYQVGAIYGRAIGCKPVRQ